MKKSFIESKYFIILLHFLIWSTFFVLQVLSFQASLSNRPVRIDIDPDRFFYRFVFHSVVMIALYYINSLIFIPKLFFKNKIGKFVIAIIFALVITLFLDYFFNHYFGYNEQINGKRPPITIYIFLFIIAVSTSIKSIQKWFENESKQKRMIHEKVNSELSFLKSQVNPHFLFNTLNGIYSLAISKSDQTAPAIVKLSQLMRYMLDESKQQFVNLSSEIDYINTFIDLQRLRLFENVKIEFNIEGKSETIKIQPLLLIPFIENAFKHGTNSTTECKIDIDLNIKDDSIQLEIKNDILMARQEDEKSGFGLSNIKRRLELEYPNCHVLTTKIVEKKFIVKLFISIK
ncbi:MAG: histidine kinase [Bacteroidales bacterium]|nr:histidine kinase [Bacteroidales bacterium]